MSNAELARQIIEKHPTLSKKELGRRLHKAYPKVFKDAEHARGFIRTVTGSNTGTSRAIQTDKYIGPRLDIGDINDHRPYVLDSKLVGVISDVHIPYHNRDVLYQALTWLKQQKIDTLILDGDIIDCFTLSTFEKDVRARSFWEEIMMLQNFLDDLRENFPTQKIIFKLGNHEKRYERYLNRQAAELRMPIQTLDFLVRQKVTKCENHEGDSCTKCAGTRQIVTECDRGIIMVRGNRSIHAGKLDIIHGDEPRGGGVNPARMFMLKRHVSTLGGHFHRSSEQLRRDSRGSVSGSWSMGCLCDLSPAYMPDNEWNWGFAMVEVEGDQFTVHNKKIINGRIV